MQQKKGFTSGFIYLYEKGADPEQKCSGGKSSFHVACEKGQLDIMKFLINLHVDIESKCESGATPLISAAINNEYPAVKFLFENGANIRATTDNKSTALSIAAGNPLSIRIVKYLIYKGADIENICSSGNTPLLYACYNKAYDNAFLLIEKGANVRQINKRQVNCLHILSARDYDEKALPLLELLINKNCDLEAKDKYGNTPLQTAIYNNNLPYVKLFISHGANKKCFDSLGKTLLHQAVENQNMEIIQYLISIGLKVNKKDNYHKTPLFYAANNEKIIQFLLDNGADPNHTDKDGNHYNEI